MLLAVIALAFAACDGSAAPPDATSTPSAAAATASPTDAEASETPETTDEASAEPTEPTPEPTAEETAEPTADAPSHGPAVACAGNESNQDFFAVFAASVDWTVYCPVLPAGWFVENGRYRLAGGGRMEIVYKGPSGARFTLEEGAVCADADACMPDGTDVGAAPLGGLDGTLFSAGDGSWAIVVDPGSNPSWRLVGTGMDEAAFRAIAAGMVVVPG